MYVRSLGIRGIRSIEALQLTFEPGREAGWHVLIGANGSGKTTIVRSLALAMLGERDIEASRENLGRWHRAGAKRSEITVEVIVPEDGRGDEPKARGDCAATWTLELRPDADPLPITHAVVEADPKTDLPWHQPQGWFSAAFGPFRRLSGGDREYDALFGRRPRLGSHLSALSEAVALTEAALWLQEMHIEELEAVRRLQGALENDMSGIMRRYLSELTEQATDTQAATDSNLARVVREEVERMVGRINDTLRFSALRATLLDDPRQSISRQRAQADLAVEFDSLSKRIIRFLNSSGFLFEGMKIATVSRDRVIVRDPSGAELGLTDLSDGYRSVLSLGIEILRSMLIRYGRNVFARHLNDAAGTIDLPGVVAIDEVEAHLHPPWQEAIGAWLQRCFPRIQFIVTTHSPIVCRAVVRDGKISGSLWQLPTPGSDALGIEQITGAKLERLIYGDLVEAASTEVFGSDIEQSEDAGEMLTQLAHLNRKMVRGIISKEETDRLEVLRRIFPTQGAR